MDGLFEILILLVIFLLPALEGMIKRRKQGEDGGGEPGPTDAHRRSGEEGVPGWSRDRAGAPSAEQAGSPGEDRSAEELLPDDLWAILTGEKRPQTRAEAPEEPSSTSLERGEPAGGEAIEAAPGGADLGGMMSGEASTAPTTPEPSYGYDVGGYGADAEPYSYDYESAPAERAEGVGPTRADVFREMDAGRESGSGIGAADGAGAGALTRAGAPGTSGLRRGRASELQQIRTGRMARRGADTGRRGGDLHPFFQGLDRTGLRRAIVLQEVLGPPLGLRNEDVLGPPPGL